MIPPEIHSRYWSHKMYEAGHSHTARAILMVEEMEKRFDNNLAVNSMLGKPRSSEFNDALSSKEQMSAAQHLKK